MTISPLSRKKINVFVGKVNPGSDQSCFVVFDEGGGIVKFLNVVLFVLLGAVSILTDQIFNGLAFYFLNLMLVEELFYLKACQLINIAFHKYKRWVGWKRLCKKVFGW